MKIGTQKEKDFYIIQLDGDLDASSSILLDNAIKIALDQKQSNIVIDCQLLQYVSSAGLGVFISYLSEFENNNIYFALLNVKGDIYSTLEILGLEKLINIIKELPNV